MNYFYLEIKSTTFLFLKMFVQQDDSKNWKIKLKSLTKETEKNNKYMRFERKQHGPRIAIAGETCHRRNVGTSLVECGSNFGIL